MDGYRAGKKCLDSYVFKYLSSHRLSDLLVSALKRLSRIFYFISLLVLQSLTPSSYAHKRVTFGKRLIDHPVIRLKLAHMIRQVEATQAQVENVTYQMKTMSHKEANLKIGGATALLKAQATTVFEYCAR